MECKFGVDSSLEGERREIKYGTPVMFPGIALPSGKREVVLHVANAVIQITLFSLYLQYNPTTICIIDSLKALKLIIRHVNKRIMGAFIT